MVRIEGARGCKQAQMMLAGRAQASGFALG